MREWLDGREGSGDEWDCAQIKWLSRGGGGGGVVGTDRRELGRTGDFEFTGKKIRAETVAGLFLESLKHNRFHGNKWLSRSEVMGMDRVRRKEG